MASIITAPGASALSLETSRLPGAHTYSPKAIGPKYPPHNANAPVFEGKDVPGLIAGIIITLGPLAAYSLGFGA